MEPRALFRRTAAIGSLLGALSCSSSDIYLGAPGTLETHAVVTVEPGRVQGSVYRLRSEARVGDAHNVAHLPAQRSAEPIELPEKYAIVAKGKNGLLSVTVDALGPNDETVGRGRGGVELIPGGPVSLTIVLEEPCSEDAECPDELFCNGRERCDDGICVPGEPVCASATGCVDSRCNEDVDTCIVTLHSDRCGPGQYCDAVGGCIAGAPCSSDEECAPLSNACYPKVCAFNHCVDGNPVDPDDSNPCTVDTCDPVRGIEQLNLSAGNVCSFDPSAPRRICKSAVDGGTLECVESECGDGFPDLTGGERCDDGNSDNDDDCTTLCARPRCGDGFIQSRQSEVCDDANQDDDDDCVACRPARCGDGFLHTRGTPPLEECDDGDEGLANDADGCDRFCMGTSYLVSLLAPVGCASSDAGAGQPLADAGCATLRNINDLTFRHHGIDGGMEYSSDLLIGDETGLYELPMTDGGLRRTFQLASTVTIPACEAIPPPWGVSTTLPDATSLRGMAALDGELVYGSAATGRMYRRLPTGPSSAWMQVFSYTANMFGSPPCCANDDDVVWRSDACVPCPAVLLDPVPRGFSSVLSRTYLVAGDANRSTVHVMSATSECGGGGANYVAFSPCEAGSGVDGGPRKAWPYVGIVPLACQEAYDVRMVMSEPENHRVLRAGVRITVDIFTRCPSEFLAVAGIEGQPGNSADNVLAAESPVDTPTGVGMDGACNIIFADSGNERVRQVSTDGKMLSIAQIPGLKTIVVHPTLGVVASSTTGLWHIYNSRR